MNTPVPAGHAVALIVLYVGCVLLGLEMFQPTEAKKKMKPPEVAEEQRVFPGPYDGGLSRLGRDNDGSKSSVAVVIVAEVAT